MSLGVPTAPTPLVAANGGASLTSGSFLPTSNSLLFAQLVVRKTATLAAPTIGDNASLAWSLLTDLSIDTGSGVRARQRVYVAPIGVAPESVQVTLTPAASSVRMNLQLLLLSGTVTIPTNVHGATDAAGDPSTLLPIAPLSTSTLIGFFAGAAASTFAVDPPSGFEPEIEDDFKSDGQMQMQSSYMPASGVAANAWSTAGASATFGSVIEIRTTLTARTLAVWM